MIIFTNIVGYLGAIVGTALMLPQAIKSYRTKNVGDLSMTTVVLYVLNCFFWLIYNILIHATPAIVANAIALVISVAQFVLKMAYEKHT